MQHALNKDDNNNITTTAKTTVLSWNMEGPTRANRQQQHNNDGKDNSSSPGIWKGQPGPIENQRWHSLLEPLYQAIQGVDPHQCITAWVVDEKTIASMIMWWEPLRRVSQSSHGKISSSGSCLPGITTCYPRHRLFPNV
jgi:hypothetical protein